VAKQTDGSVFQWLVTRNELNFEGSNLD